MNQYCKTSNHDNGQKAKAPVLRPCTVRARNLCSEILEGWINGSRQRSRLWRRWTDDIKDWLNRTEQWRNVQGLSETEVSGERWYIKWLLTFRQQKKKQFSTSTVIINQPGLDSVSVQEKKETSGLQSYTSSSASDSGSHCIRPGHGNSDTAHCPDNMPEWKFPRGWPCRQSSRSKPIHWRRLEGCRRPLYLYDPLPVKRTDDDDGGGGGDDDAIVYFALYLLISNSRTQSVSCSPTLSIEQETLPSR